MTVRELLDAVREDARVNGRYGGHLATITVTVYRLGAFSRQRGPLAMVARLAHTVLDLVWTKLIIGADIPASAQIGPRLHLGHAGHGVFIHEHAVIGSDVTISHQVSIGVRWPQPGAPTIGNRVYLGAKCSVFGAISVGDRARIGAHALVLRDVAAGATAYGVPAVAH